jgi:hypothetical protein
VVDPDHPDGPQRYDVYSNITFLPSDEVRALEPTLRAIDLDDLLGAIPDDRGAQLRFFETSSPYVPDDAKRYYRDSFVALRDFVSGAAAGNLALVMWWD